MALLRSSYFPETFYKQIPSIIIIIIMTKSHLREATLNMAYTQYVSRYSY